MAQLAIRGHATRGKEVIEILEMLGGENEAHLKGMDTILVYRIGSESYITTLYANFDKYYKIFTLEGFLQEFPYKVGDKVKNSRINDFIGRITSARWDNDEEQIIYTVEWDDKSILTYFARGLQPYKEETMKDNIIDTVKENDDRYRIVLNHQFDMKVDEGEYYAVRRKPQYPKTYAECCEVLSINELPYMVYTWNRHEDVEEVLIESQFTLLQQLENLRRIIICRNTYWKIAGEQMGLGKPWEPNWNNGTDKYVIITYKNCVVSDILWNSNALLAFPTTEMRDTFLENFKNLIEQCKELL